VRSGPIRARREQCDGSGLTRRDMRVSFLGMAQPNACEAWYQSLAHKAEEMKVPGPLHVHLNAMSAEYFAQCALHEPPPGPEEVEIMWVDFLKTLQRLRDAHDESTTHSVLEAFLLGVAMARESERDPHFWESIRHWSHLILRRRDPGWQFSWVSPPTTSESGQQAPPRQKSSDQGARQSPPTQKFE